MQAELETNENEQLIFDTLQFHFQPKGRNKHGGNQVGHHANVWQKQ